MQYRSTEIGGNTQGRGILKAHKMARDGQEPDFRLCVTNKPLGAMAADKDLAEKFSKSVNFLDGSKYADANGTPVEYMISGIGSSSLVDTDGDVFHKSAIEGMARDSIDLNILMNHVGTVPWNIAGSVLETEVDFLRMHDGTEHCVLKLVTDIEKAHPDAWEAYCMIAGIEGRRQRKLGFSVGCLYVDTQPRATKGGIYRGHDVFEVLPVEFSIVSMPANRLAWIDGKQKSFGLNWAEAISEDLQEKGVIPLRENYRRKKGLRAADKQMASDPEVVYRIRNWMDFGPVDGPKLERLAKTFEERYGIVYAMPRSS